MIRRDVFTHTVVFFLGVLIAFLVFSDKTETASKRGLGIRPISRIKDKKSADRQMQDMIRGINNKVSGSFSMMAGGSFQVEESEDSEFYSIFLKGKGIDKNSLEVDISSGRLTIKGQTTRTKKGQWGSSRFQSSFQRSFTLPRGIDQSRPDMVVDEEGLVIKFPKNK